MASGKTLRLYDTLAREKRDFVPLDPGHVRMYVCGPTVYDFAHIGNARPVIVFDVLYRLLRHLYGADHVTYVRNITDVDDKINARAAEEYPGLPLNEAIAKVTAKTEAQFHEDVAALGCLPPTAEPRATRHIEAMKGLIERLVGNGHAYVAEGHVLFDVASMPDYGRLSRRSLDDLVAGARVDVAPYKKGPMDFVLWKPSKPGEPAWPSPCGIEAPGRPGWHIECSAMSREHLGDVFDIHGGGIDLVFPHHENEIAQSRCALNTPAMANYWMHNGFLMVEGEKMSKSLGNFVTIRDALAEWPGWVIRLTILMTHYRQPIDYKRSSLEEAKTNLDRWRSAIGEITEYNARILPSQHLIDALTDDLDTHRAIQSLHRTAKEAATSYDRAAQLAADMAFLGIFPSRSSQMRLDMSDEELSRYMNRVMAPVRSMLSGSSLKRDAAADLGIDVDAVEAQVTARIAAKKARNFAEADRIRDALAAMGVALKDGKDPETGEPVTTWEVAR
jgi:cysteinyl-tRNA synthetase